MDKKRHVEAWKAINEARAKIDAAEKEARELSAEEQEFVDRATDEGVELLKVIDAEASQKRLVDIYEELNKVERPMVKETEGTKEEEQAEARSKAFERYIRTGEVTPELKSTTYQAEGTDADGGYLVPDEFLRRLVQPLADSAPMLGLCSQFQASGMTVLIPRVSAHGSAAWTAEHAAFTESLETFDQPSVTIYKAATVVPVTEELMADSAFDLDGYLAGEIGRRFGALVNTALTVGTGSSQPYGAITQTTNVLVFASSSAITADEIYDTKHDLPVQYRPRAVWMMNDATLKLISKLKGTQNDHYMFQPALSADVPGTILGHRYVINPDVVNIGINAKFLGFGDYSYHWVFRRPGISVQRLNELYALSGEVAFRAYMRIGADLVLPAACTVGKGAAS